MYFFLIVYKNNNEMKQIKNLLRRPQKTSMKEILSFLCFFTILSYQTLFAQCDPGTTLAEFTWEGAATGSQSVWNVDDVSNTYTGIDGTNLDVTLDLDDPFDQNTDSGNLSDFGDATESNGFYGPGFLSFQITSSASNQDVCFTYNFSTPVYIGEFLVRDIDSNGEEGDNGELQSFQDQVTLSATGIGGANVPLTLTPEGANPVFTITGQTATGNYTDGVANGVAHTDPNGGILVSTPELLTSLTLCYSNGPDDLDGLSNSNAIAIPGSNFCIPEPATISGIVVDDNGDPLAGAVVTLQNLDGTTALDLNGNPITITTGPDGTYLFEDVPPGDYNIVENDPSGYVSDSSSDNTNDGVLDGETGAGTDENTIPVSIIGGEDDTGNDFVDELLTGSISGTVLEDTDNDGVGDIPIEGVTIALLDDMGNPVLDDMGNPITTVTAADGTYSFDDVPPGDYQVLESDPPGYVSVSDTDGGNDNCIGNTMPISVTGGEDTPGNDFVDAPIVVPVELISFTADMRDAYVNLEWLTANETNNSHFEIERSIDGSNFQKIGKVNGQINSQTKKSYNFIDADISANTLYYRLKQVDLNGFYTHTKTVVVDIVKDKDEFKATIFPNPASSKFIISYESDNNDSTQLNIYNLQGQIIMTREYSSNVSIDISSLNSGTYIVHLSNQKGEQIIRRIIKN
jgi:hypothetical protein